MNNTASVSANLVISKVSRNVLVPVVAALAPSNVVIDPASFSLPQDSQPVPPPEEEYQFRYLPTEGLTSSQPPLFRGPDAAFYELVQLAGATASPPSGSDDGGTITIVVNQSTGQVVGYSGPIVPSQ